MMGSPSASSMAISVSMVKLCVPRIHLLISDSFFPRRSARSFCFRPLAFSISCILSTILKDKSNHAPDFRIHLPASRFDYTTRFSYRVKILSCLSVPYLPKWFYHPWCVKQQNGWCLSTFPRREQAFRCSARSWHPWCLRCRIWGFCLKFSGSRAAACCLYQSVWLLHRHHIYPQGGNNVPVRRFLQSCLAMRWWCLFHHRMHSLRELFKEAFKLAEFFFFQVDAVEVYMVMFFNQFNVIFLFHLNIKVNRNANINTFSQTSKLNL